MQCPALYQRTNVEGTVNVLESARKHGVKKLTLENDSLKKRLDELETVVNA